MTNREDVCEQKDDFLRESQTFSWSNPGRLCKQQCIMNFQFGITWDALWFSYLFSAELPKPELLAVPYQSALGRGFQPTKSCLVELHMQKI